MLLPEISVLEEYRRIYRDAGVWLPAMRVICQRHGLDPAQLEFAPPGSHVVFKVAPDRYIKLFAPLWRDDYTPELLALGRLSDRPDLPAPIPRLVGEGEVEGWPYIIMTAVEGVVLNDVWGAMEMSNKERIAAQCGELMASFHTMPTEGFEPIGVEWPTFVAHQVQDCVDGVGQSDLGEGWTREVTEFFDRLPPLYEPGFQPVFLNADITDEHVLVSQSQGRWEMTGYIDFGDAMLGHPHYEFAAPSCVITRGSPVLQRAMMLAYGYSEDQLDGELADRLMAYTLLHRFIDLPYLVQTLRPHTASLELIKNALWSFSSEPE